MLIVTERYLYVIIKQKHHKFKISHLPKLQTLSNLLYQMITVGNGLRGVTALLEGIYRR